MRGKRKQEERKRGGSTRGLSLFCPLSCLFCTLWPSCMALDSAKKTVYYNKVKENLTKHIYAELNKKGHLGLFRLLCNFKVNKILFCLLLTKRKNGIHSNTLQEYSANSLLFQSHKNKLCGTERAIASVMFSQREQKKVYCTTKLSQSHPKTSAGM